MSTARTPARSLSRRSQEERKAETRARLLEAAAALVADQGIEAVSVDAVAQAAGRTSGAVYAHFGSKQGMLLALLDRWSQTLLGEVAARFEQAADLHQRLQAVASGVVVDPSAETKRLLALERELWRLAARDRSMATAMQSRSADSHARMTRGLATWMDEGLIAANAEPATLATAVRALVVGLEMQQRIDHALDVDEATAVLAALLCDVQG